MKLRLDYLQTFKEVVEEGSFLGASKALGMSVSTISLHIDAVEKFFEARLLERNVSGVKLTREGEIAYNSIKELFTLLEKTKKGIKNLSTKIVNIGIGCVGVPIIAEIQMGYKEVRPDVDVRVKLTGEYTCLELLEHGEVSVVLAGYPTPLKLGDGYRVEEIGYDRFVLIVPPNHELAKKREVTIEDVLSYPMVTLNKGYSSTAIEDTLRELRNIEKEQKIECSVNDIFSQIYGVSSGLGTAIASYVLSKRYEEGGLVVIKEIKDFTDERPIYAITTEKALENPVIADFFDYLVERGTELLKKYRLRGG